MINFLKENDCLTDDEIIKLLLNKQKFSTKTSRLKSFPIELKFELFLTTLNEIKSTIITPEFVKINEKNSDSSFYKDILEFPKPGSFIINSFYRNLLYVYPKMLNLTSKSSNARNITIKIQLMDANKKESLFWIFGNSKNPNFVSSYSTAVSYHTKFLSFCLIF